MRSTRSPIPVSFFSIAVGTLALANAWHVAARVWKLPEPLAHAFTALGLATWLALTALYAHKWLRRREQALAELQHPVQSSLAALVPISTLLAAMALLPYSRAAAMPLFAVAMAAQLALGLWLYGRFWQGGRQPELVTPALYLPTVGHSFVAAAAAAAFGWPQLGLWCFGAGLFCWLAIESLVLGRAATQEPVPQALRPLLGVQLAPPVVGGVAYMALTTGVPDLFAQLLLGYGLYQALLMLRLLPWLTRQAFVPSYWAFSFGVAALPTLAMCMLERGATGPLEWLAPVLFVASNGVIGLMLVKTLALWARGELLPVAPAPTPKPPAD